jgi:hypothetical protein
VLGKILKREVILPLFHCYIGEPPSCLLDVLFDPLSLSLANLTYLEHAFIYAANPPLPLPCVISLKTQQQRGELYQNEILLEDLAEFLEGRRKCVVLQLQFPETGRNGFHLSLTGFPDRYERGGREERKGGGRRGRGEGEEREGEERERERERRGRGRGRGEREIGR